MVQLGNPVLEFATDFNSRAEFFWSHGLISDSTYKMFTSACNYSRYVSEYYRDSVSLLCSKVMSQVSRETSRFVDKYDVTLDVCISSVLSQSKVLTPHVSSQAQFLGFFSICVSYLQLIIYVCFKQNSTASYRDSWCLCGRWNGELLEQARCAEISSCTSGRSHPMGCLQQVILLTRNLCIDQTAQSIRCQCLFDFIWSCGRFLFDSVSWIMSILIWRYQQSLSLEKSLKLESQSWFTGIIVFFFFLLS